MPKMRQLHRNLKTVPDSLPIYKDFMSFVNLIIQHLFLLYFLNLLFFKEKNESVQLIKKYIKPPKRIIFYFIALIFIYLPSAHSAQ